MAKQFLIQILTVATIFLLIGMCVSFPHYRDTSTQLENCDKSVPHIVIINSTDGRILNCHKCTFCQQGYGLSTPCNGQNVSQTDLNVECRPCVAGVNFSTGEMIQCQPCQKPCPNGMKIEGKCEVIGDKRTCRKCEISNWYYNTTLETCLPCVCKNMTAEVKHICIRLGFKFDMQCKHINFSDDSTRNTSTNTSTNVPFYPQNKERDNWRKPLIITVVIIGIIVIGIIAYCCCIKGSRELCINHPWCSKDTICCIFCYNQNTSRPPSYHSDIGEDRRVYNNGCAEQVRFLRQSSCPVTQNEKMVVKGSPPVNLEQQDVKFSLKSTDCEQKKLKFFQMNSEICREICQKLKQNIQTGMGYPTLAGFMGFSADKVKSFECEGDVCENMMMCWSSLDQTNNNVLKLKDLVVRLKRDDILELLKSELKRKSYECGCPECMVIL
ncbi:uncharacterized protein LOC114533635 [Dendronephthya gigantea]|uniref:uncharacterized protein LOC114533635 n=1 Tax=Dendronephthya gigantea TaxID=151771 RepID=UPI001069C0D0|nr:uncharacterized protein LOC114533635 [Dendronephthya gigantea]